MKSLHPSDYQPEVHCVNYGAVKKEQVWGPRTIPDFELILIVAGCFFYSSEKTGWMMCEAGDVLCIPPGCEHTVGVASGIQGAVFSCIHLDLARGSWLHGEYALESFPPVITRTGNDPVVHQLFKRCENIYAGFSPNREALLQAVSWEILLHLEEFREGGIAHLSPRMRQMLDAIQAHVYDPFSRAELAREFSISPEHVNAIFKKELNSTPTQQIHRAKVFQAYACLTYDGLSVKETAEKLSFYDEFYFSKVFKKVIGMSPSHVRPRSVV